MPYITQAQRELFSDPATKPTKPGELNYLITKLVDSYLMMNGVSYTHINAVIGVLQCAQLELYRKVASLYEDKKERENGGVYSCI